MIQSYKDLVVWQHSMNLVESVYKITVRIPKSEQFELASQMRRAVVSVPSNIAEGYGRRATGEYRHHLSISRGSLLELETQLLIARRLKYVDDVALSPLLKDIEAINKMLNSLISKLS